MLACCNCMISMYMNTQYTRQSPNKSVITTIYTSSNKNIEDLKKGSGNELEMAKCQERTTNILTDANLPWVDD